MPLDEEPRKEKNAEETIKTAIMNSPEIQRMLNEMIKNMKVKTS